MCPERILTTPSELGEYVPPIVTGNEWVSLPDISPDDASIGSINVIHMRTKGLVEWTGDFGADGRGGRCSDGRRGNDGGIDRGDTPFLAPFVADAHGQRAVAVAPSGGSRLSWSRLSDWVPRASTRMRTPGGDEFSLDLTVCAPVGEKGCVFLFELHSLRPASGSETAASDADCRPVELTVGLSGCWASTMSTSFRRRTMHVRNHVSYYPWTNSMILEARGESSVAALALSASESFRWWARRVNCSEDETSSRGICEVSSECHDHAALDVSCANGEGDVIRFEVSVDLILSPGSRSCASFVLAANADPDGAGTTAIHLRRIGAHAAITDTLRWLDSRSYRGHAQTSGDAALSRANHNLHFCRFFAHGRAIDTEELVMLTSRSHRYYVSAAFWPRDTHLWAFPAILASDPEFAREVLLTSYSKHVRNMGVHAHYIDGVLLYPGLELDQVASYVIALGRYVEATGDYAVANEPPIRAGLSEFARILEEVRHPEMALYRTFLDPSDDPVRYPYLTYDNMLVWAAMGYLARIWSRLGRVDLEEHWSSMATHTADAIREHCVEEGPVGPMFVWSTNLEGDYELYDDPPGSLVLMPYYGFAAPDDQVFANTVFFIRSELNPHFSKTGVFSGAGCAHSPRPWPMHACNMILAGIATREDIDMITEAPLDGGLACETIYESSGRAATGAGFATAAGYLSTALASAGGAALITPRR